MTFIDKIKKLINKKKHVSPTCCFDYKTLNGKEILFVINNN